MDVFFPCYVDQERLLDLYSLLNGGYIEYEEIRMDSSEEKRGVKKGAGELSGGFKMFKMGASISASMESGSTSSEVNSSAMRRVQTVPSMLQIVLKQLREKKLLSDMGTAKEGSMVLFQMTPALNSFSGFLQEAKELMKLAQEMEDVNSPDGGGKKKANPTIKTIEKMASVGKKLFDAEELVGIEDDFAVFGNVVNENLYQSMRSDITGVRLHCLAQIRKLYPCGTELMKNTAFSKIKDESVKSPLIDAMKDMAVSGGYEFDSQLVPALKDRPVYQLKIIALFQMVQELGSQA